AHSLNVNKKERPISWQYGEVVSQIDNFATALATAFEKHRTFYQMQQRQVIADLIYHPKEKPSITAAKAIQDLLSNQ
ncbi:MAG: hypothetical protein AB8G22_27300, partial [Saprospiraceae bacterium]